MREPAHRGARGNIKGVAVAEFFTWYRQRYGTAAILDVSRAANAIEENALDPGRSGLGILQSRWYPVAVIHAALDAVVKRHSPAELLTVTEAGSDHVMGKTLNGIYRTIFSICVSPERYARHVPKLWGLHYDNGTPIVVITAAREHTMTFSRWESHHPLACALNMAASRPIYAAMGCKGVKYTREGCVSTGAPQCQLTIRWA